MTEVNTKQDLANVMNTTPENVKFWAELNEGQKQSVREQWASLNVVQHIFHVRLDNDFVLTGRFIGHGFQGADLIFQASEFAETFEVEDHEFDGETGAHVFFDEVGNVIEVRPDGSVVEIPSEDL